MKETRDIVPFMKVLIVTPACHFAKAGAAQEDISAIIRHLREMGHVVALYTIDSPSQSRGTLEALRTAHGIEVRTFLPDLDNTTRWLMDVFREPAYVDRGSYVFGQLIEDPGFTQYVTAVQPDILFSFCSYSWPVFAFAQRLGIKSIFRSHNFEPAFFFESLETLQKWNPMNWLRYLAKWRGERLATVLSGSVAPLPFAEVALYRKWRHGHAVFILTLAFLDRLLRAPVVHTGKRPLDVFFLGASYNVVFHARGARMLITDIAPKILARAPGAFRFHICGGKLPADLVTRCDGTQVIYEGYVDDLDAFLDGMDIGAFPVMTGKTIKGKIFHSLCRSFPVVIPSIGMGGYALHDGEEALIADTADAFVESVLSLQDDRKRQKLAEGAHQFCRDHFTKDRIQESLRSALE